MTSTSYSFKVSSSSGSVIYNGYFNVDNTTNLVTNFYDYSLPITGGYTDVLLPKNDPASWSESNNIYPIDKEGLNFYSTALQNYFGISQNHLNLYKTQSNFGLWSDATVLPYIPYTIVIEPIISPISNICFPAGTLITCNQGNVPIELLNPEVHTIRNKKLVCVTKTRSVNDYLVCFEKHSLGNNIPSQKTVMTKDHAIFFNGKMKTANEFLKESTGVYKVNYTGESLYNVLMEEHDKMMVNNLICETLNPENPMAKLHILLQKYTPEQQALLIKEYNDFTIKSNNFSKKQLKQIM
jgi:hypothetical protein